MTRPDDAGPTAHVRPAYPAGVAVRGVRAADLDLALDLVHASQSRLTVAAPANRDDVRHLLAGPSSDRGSHRIVLQAGRAVGLLAVVPVEGRTVFLEVHVRPGTPPGLRDALLADGVATARRIAAAEPAVDAADPGSLPDPRRWQVGAGAHGEDLEARRALTDAGFREVLRFWRMRLGLCDRGHPAAPVAPTGVTRTVARSDAELRAVHAVVTESFRDHAGVVPRPYDVWLTALRSRPGFDPDQVWLVRRDGRPVAVAITDDSRAGSGDAFLRTLGVLPEARRRGIARWLLACVVADAARRGRRGLLLTVDSRSPTGANRLYESAGMTVVEVVDEWRRPLP